MGAPPCRGPGRGTKSVWPALGHAHCQAGRQGTGTWVKWKTLSWRTLGGGEVGWGEAPTWPLQGTFLRATQLALHSIGTPLLDHTLRSPGWGPAREPPCWLLPQSSHPDSPASTSFPQMPSSFPTSSMAALIVSNCSGSPFSQQLGPVVLPTQTAS